MQKSPPKPAWHTPFLKRFFKSSTHSLDFLEYLVRDEDIVRLPMLKTNYIVNDPEAIHHILLVNKDNYTKEGTGYEKLLRILGRGLLTTSGEDWDVRRQQYQPHFHGNPIKLCLPIIYKYTQAMLEKWELEKSSPINISEEMLALTMNISSEALLGIDVSNHSLELVRQIHILNNYAVKSHTLWKWLPTLPNLRFQSAKKNFYNFMLTQIRQLQTPEQEPLLDSLLKKNAEGKFMFSEQAILEEVNNFFIAGHETTGTALSWTLYNLVKNPYALTQVQAEIKQILGTEIPTLDCLEKFIYLDMVIAESLRLYPPIWIFSRQAIHDDTLSNYSISANSLVNIIPYLIHRHPKHWTQPHVFYPERFSKEAVKSRHKCAYIPFGFGPRFCIGRQFALFNMKIILVMLLQRFEIRFPNADFWVAPDPLITLKPHQEVYLKFN